jgi:pilus assembly protein Flp/PilA
MLADAWRSRWVPPRPEADEKGSNMQGIRMWWPRLVLGRDEDGQGLAEYALILALIAIVSIVALIFLGGQISTILAEISGKI